MPVVDGGNAYLVDSADRPRERYTGEWIRHAVQGGHIPGAIHIVSLDRTDGQSPQWRSLEKVAVLYKGAPKTANVIVYCHDGFRMTLAWLIRITGSAPCRAP